MVVDICMYVEIYLSMSCLSVLLCRVARLSYVQYMLCDGFMPNDTYSDDKVPSTYNTMYY